jgi:hypothetical protein
VDGTGSRRRETGSVLVRGRREVTGGGLRRVHLRIATRPAVCKYADAAGADDSNCAEVVVPIRLGKSTRDHAARIATLRTGPSSRFDGRRSSTLAHI